MPSRDLGFPVFDADNHMYETKDALTRHLPAEYAGIIRYVEVDGRTKIAVKGADQRLHPEPHLRPGGRVPVRRRSTSGTATPTARAAGRSWVGAWTALPPTASPAPASS